MNAKRPIFLLCSLTIVGLLVQDCFAILPSSSYQAARKNAAYHVQVRIVSVSIPDKTPGECMVQGTTERIFRDNAKNLKPNQSVSFQVSCLKEGDPMSPPGGTLWTRVERLQAAKYMEVYLDRAKGGHFHIPLWQSQIIEGISAQPALSEKR